jgi:hypothetical protein
MWCTRYRDRFGKLVADRQIVVSTDKSGRAVITEAGCTALNNVCEVKDRAPDLKRKIEATLVQLNQQQCNAIKRLLRMEPAKVLEMTAKIETESTVSPTPHPPPPPRALALSTCFCAFKSSTKAKIAHLDEEFDDIRRKCMDLQQHTIGKAICLFKTTNARIYVRLHSALSTSHTT